MGSITTPALMYATYPTRPEYSNATATIEQAASDACESVYDKEGAVAFNKCREDYKKSQKTGVVTSVLDTVNNVFDFFKDRRGNSTQPYTPTYLPPAKKSNTIWWVVGGLAVVGIGVGIYFMTKKK
jgi:hypothetical protein